jgi:two-component system, OmpR family, osmolarity sensor histidine kinase EnvZ
MKWAVNGILLRLMLAQTVVITVAFAAMVFMVGQQRGAAAARTIAALWADSMLQALDAPRVDGDPRARVSLHAGPPPPQATTVRALRYRALREELAQFGIVVGEIRSGRADGREVTWLSVHQPGSGQARWIGFDGGVFGPDESVRRWPLVVFVFALVFIASAALTWSVVRPLARLQRAIERFRACGDGSSGLFERGAETGRHGPRELRELERSFADMARERAQLEQDRTLMLAGVSHDLRSPLARIRLSADLMPDDNAAVAVAKAAIKRNVDLADRHLAAFLDFAAPAAADEITSVEVAALWRDAIAMALPETPARSLRIDGDVAALRSNRRLLVRVLACGLENAHKHGVAPIDARCFTRGGDTVFEIEDAGAGLAPAERERVMRPFERGERGRTKPGTGLGLALAAQIAARLGGRVEIDQARRGLIFRCIVTDSAAA